MPSRPEETTTKPSSSEQLSRLLAGIAKGPTRRPTCFSEFKTPGVSIKYHASCRHTHPSVDALLELMHEHGLAADDLGAVRAYLYTGAYELLVDVVPTTPWAAKFSLPFCLAQAALRGHLSLSAFTEEALTDPRVTRLMERVSLSIDPSLDEIYPRFWPARVEVETTSGDVFSCRIDTPKGDPENPVTDAELDAKFLLLASGTLAGDDPDRLLGRLRDSRLAHRHDPAVRRHRRQPASRSRRAIDPTRTRRPLQGRLTARGATA